MAVVTEGNLLQVLPASQAQAANVLVIFPYCFLGTTLCLVTTQVLSAPKTISSEGTERSLWTLDSQRDQAQAGNCSVGLQGY